MAGKPTGVHNEDEHTRGENDHNAHVNKDVGDERNAVSMRHHIVHRPAGHKGEAGFENGDSHSRQNQRHEEAAIWEGMPEDLRPKAQIEAFAEDIFLRCPVCMEKGEREGF